MADLQGAKPWPGPAGWIARLQEPLLRHRLEQFPAVALLGPRQMGKTTLALQLAATTPSLYAAAAGRRQGQANGRFLLLGRPCHPKRLPGLPSQPWDTDPDQLLPVIAATLRSSAADLELQKVEQIGGLAMAIFGRVAHEESYGEAIGRPVRIEEIQPVVNELLADNLLMRVGEARGLSGCWPVKRSKSPNPKEHTP